MVDSIDPSIAVAAPHGLSPIDLFQQADTVVKAVLIILLLASAWGWAVIVDKLVRLYLLQKRADTLIASIQSGLPVTSVAESFERASETDPFVTVYKAMVEENNRSAELVFSRFPAGQSSGAGASGRSIGQYRRTRAFAEPFARLGYNWSGGSLRWTVWNGLGNYDLVPRHCRLQ